MFHVQSASMPSWRHTHWWHDCLSHHDRWSHDQGLRGIVDITSTLPCKWQISCQQCPRGGSPMQGLCCKTDVYHKVVVVAYFDSDSVRVSQYHVTARWFYLDEHDVMVTQPWVQELSWVKYDWYNIISYNLQCTSREAISRICDSMLHRQRVQTLDVSFTLMITTKDIYVTLLIIDSKLTKWRNVMLWWGWCSFDQTCILWYLSSFAQNAASAV